MKYVLMVHSHPDPWGHPTASFTPEGQAIAPETMAAMDEEFDQLLEELAASGELVTAEALGDPADSTIYTWGRDRAVRGSGPLSSAGDQLAGYFVLDCATRARAEEIAVLFATPGDTIELRPTPGAP
jgi:hypothetical protein